MVSFAYYDKTEDLVGLVVDGKLHLEHPAQVSEKESIYRARVIKEIPSLKAFLMELPQGQALLRKRDCLYEVKGGDEILVMLSNEGYDEKLPLLTMRYKLTSPYYVYEPFGRRWNVSRKIPDGKKLREEVQGVKGGGIVRTKAKDLTAQERREELEKLLEEQDQLQAERHRLPTPKALRMRRTRFSGFPRGETLLTNDKVSDQEREQFEKVVYDPDFQAKTCPEIVQGRGEKEKGRAEVPLEDGVANLVIDVCTALSVVDVNQGSALFQLPKNEMARRVNLACVQDIVRLFRLKECYGILLVDFIRGRLEDLSELERAFLEACDRADFQGRGLGFTNSGLYEYIRHRKS